MINWGILAVACGASACSRTNSSPSATDRPATSAPNAVAPTAATESPRPPSNTAAIGNFAKFDELKAAYDTAFNVYRQQVAAEAQASVDRMAAARAAAEKELESAKTDDDKAEAQARLLAASSMPAMKAMTPADGPGTEFAPRFLQFATDHADDPQALASLGMALRTSGGPLHPQGIWHQALKLLRERFLTAPQVRTLLTALAAVHDDASRACLRDIIAKHPDRGTQARAAKALAEGLVHSAEYGEFLEANEVVRQRSIDQFGTPYVESLVRGSTVFRAESDRLKQLLRSTYTDVLPDLSIGQVAPEVISRDLDDRPVKLSDLRGRVVVLDIWATWCGPCLAMIPHEREMVERLREQPFTLVSINADEEKATLVQFLGREKMPWTHWWNGREGGILESWDIHAFPTIFVLDAQGVIRFTDLRGEELEEAVQELLRE